MSESKNKKPVNWNDFTPIGNEKKTETKNINWNDFTPIEEDQDTDNPLTRGWNKAKNSMGISKDLAMGDAASAAQRVKEANDYAQANPGTKEGKVLSAAWERGDGITGGIAEVAGQIKQNVDDSTGFIGGARSLGKDLKAMGSGLLEQVPNMVAPMTGMAAGSKVGGMAGGAIGAAFGGAGALPGAARPQGRAHARHPTARGHVCARGRRAASVPGGFRQLCQQAGQQLHQINYRHFFQ